VALLLLLFVLPAASRDPLVEKARSLLVEVPVHVTIDGEPLRGLTIDNFEIYDRGKLQEINSLDVLDLSLLAGGEADALAPHVSLAARRHFLLLFDLTHSKQRSLARARDAVGEWVGSALHPWDLVAVATYSGRTGARLLLNFTSDREQIRLAVDTMGLPEFLDIGEDPLALEIGAPGQITLEADGKAVGADKNASAGEQRAMDALEAIFYASYDPLQRQGLRQRVTDLTLSFTQLVQMVRGVRGRKHVVYLSEGIDSSLLFADQVRGEVERLNTASEFGQYHTIESSRRFGSAQAQRRILDMVDAFHEADTTIQAINIGEIADPNGTGGLSSRGTDSLFFMANETGGELYNNFSSAREPMQRLLQKTSVTYLLTFRPGKLKPDGKFHKLKVKLKGDVPGKARVSHRSGYFAPQPYGDQTEADHRMEAANLIMSGHDGGGMAASVLAAAFPGAGGAKAYVPVLIELDGTGLALTSGRSPLELEIYTYAIDRDGRIEDYFTQTLDVDTRTFGSQLQRTGLKFYGDLELGPGDYSLRVLVRDRQDGEYASRAVVLHVPRFDAAGPEVSPPLFPEAPGKWLLARETVAEGAPEPPFPFRLGDKVYLPAARPVLESRGESNVCLVVHHLGDGPVALEAQVLDAAGTVAREPRINLWERVENATEDQDVLVASFDPDGLAAGDYLLSVTVSNQATGASRTNSIPFTVVQRERATEMPRPIKTSFDSSAR
jgi:VWFA-related protein